MRQGALAVVALVVLACSSQPQPSQPQPSQPQPSQPAVTGSAGATLPLRVNQSDGCDTIQVQYRTATFRIDPAAADPVTAITDQGASLQTFWASGFEGGSAGDPVVRDPDGQVVAADGEVLTIPVGAFPILHGHWVCPSEDALYVFLPDAP